MLARKSVHTWVQRCAYAVRAFSNIRHVDDIVGIDFGTSTSRLAIMDAEVKAKEFDSSPRGEDFDLVLVEYMVEEIRRLIRGCLWRQSSYGEVKEAAEKAKLELSSSCETLIDLPCLTGSRIWSSTCKHRTFGLKI
ncbi:hypothetical protein LOK49_LG11G00018 [Camellia lanceoleosa]|uniref:Uncharacterized protein n=1 Tax=Camellia lanceoleosa TaxID=1840588 RepID=A0ACC0G2Y7_9ERIC|nr:hypothetical protein LOK49_LG11G00018 [Camellia lanceoleosa]